MHLGSQLSRSLRHVLLHVDLQGGSGGGYAQGVGVRGGIALERLSLGEGVVDAVADADGAEGQQSAVYPLSQAHNIRNDAELVHAPGLAGAAEPGLNLVGDEENIVFLGYLPDHGPPLVGGPDDAAVAHGYLSHQAGNGLRSLVDDGALDVFGAGHIALGVGETEGALLAVVVGRLDHLRHTPAEGAHSDVAPGHAPAEEGAAVIATVQGHHLVAARLVHGIPVVPGGLDANLGGLGAGAGDIDPVQVAGEGICQLGAVIDIRLGGGVGRARREVCQLLHLLADGILDRLGRMSQITYVDTTRGGINVPVTI